MINIDFEERFAESKGQSITSGDITYCMLHRIRIKTTTIIRLIIIQSRPPYRQGIHIEGDGLITIGKCVRHAFVLWNDTAPTPIEVEATAGEIRIWNVWDTGDGVTQSWHNGAAMIVENESPTVLTFKCNDGRPNSDCDDLVFRCEIHETA